MEHTAYDLHGTLGLRHVFIRHEISEAADLVRNLADDYRFSHDVVNQYENDDRGEAHGSIV